MKLQDLFKVIPDAERIQLVMSDFSLSGTKESMDIMLHTDIMDCEVENIEARSDELWVWLK